MADCLEELNPEDVGLFCPEDVDAGIAEEIYYAVAEHIDEIPAVATTAKTFAEKVTISEAITMLSGKGFAKMKLQVDLNSLSTALTGNTGNKKVSTTIAAFLAGVKPQLIGFQKEFKNLRLVFIIPDNNGNNWLVGDKLKPARFDAFDVTTGITDEDNNGATLSIISKKSPMLYTGAIPMVPVTEEGG